MKKEEEKIIIIIFYLNKTQFLIVTFKKNDLLEL
jgi:hypothetical protein